MELAEHLGEVVELFGRRFVVAGVGSYEVDLCLEGPDGHCYHPPRKPPEPRKQWSWVPEGLKCLRRR